MPPKKARGAAARGRGRGRGRGTIAQAPDPADVNHDEPEDPSTGTSKQNEETISPGTTGQVVTPQNLNEAPSPNSSPVTVPTETPAPTPARILPPPRNSAAGPSSSTRGNQAGLLGREKTAAATSRFKPKAVRRDDTEREELARKEQARLERANASYAREQARLLRARGGRGRGRGDIMGGGLGRAKPGTASGIFSVAPEGLKNASGVSTFRRDGGGGGGGGGSSSSSGVRTKGSGGYSGYSGGGGGSGGSDRKGWIEDPEYPDEDTNAPRVNIEDLNKEEVDDEVTYVGTHQMPVRNKRVLKSAAGGLDPIRLERIEHKERTTVVNTDVGIKSEEDDPPTIDESRSTAKTQVKEFKGVYHGEEDVKVKLEALEEDTQMLQDQPLASSLPAQPASVTASPESKRKVIDSGMISDTPNALDANTSESIAAGDDTPSIAKDAKLDAQKEKKVQRQSAKRDKVPVFQTEEDKEEWGRIQQDLQILKEELYGPPTVAREHNLEGDVQSDATAPVDRNQGRLYLFQFPPVMPILYDPLVEEKPKMRWQIEKEEADWRQGKGKEPATSTNKAKGKTKVDLTAADDTKIKVEEEVEAGDKKREDQITRDPLATREGYVGKLRVYKSGKTELDWGGITFNVGRGAGSNFLTTGMIVDFKEQVKSSGGPPEGTAYSMGQVMGKFVATPDWETLLR